jgi:hypothetical protein
MYLTILCIPAVLLLLSSTEGWSLPPCGGSDYSTWTNCTGTYTYANGDKYVGEYRDGNKHGYGVYTKADGRVIRKGTWVYDEFLD